MNGRVYDPSLGRFLSVDPLFQFPTNTQSLNPYTYALNSPLTLTDPTGLANCSTDDPTSCLENGMNTVTNPEDGSQQQVYVDGTSKQMKIAGGRSYSSVEIEGMGSIGAGGGGKRKSGSSDPDRIESVDQRAAEPTSTPNQQGATAAVPPGATTAPEPVVSGGKQSSDSGTEKPKPATLHLMPDPEKQVGKAYKNDKGNTECVELLRQGMDAPKTGDWVQGDSVKPGAELKPGTPIATFKDGKYPQTGDTGKHAAVVTKMDKDGKGVWVVDQWRAQGEVRERLIRFRDSSYTGSASNNANSFSTVLWSD